MRACMITPGAHEPGGAATVKRPARPRGVWFGRTDTMLRLKGIIDPTLLQAAITAAGQLDGSREGAN